jgi:hypothetical protein
MTTKKATADATADPYGMRNKRTRNGKGNSRALELTKHERKQKATADPCGMTKKKDRQPQRQ